MRAPSCTSARLEGRFRPPGFQPRRTTAQRAVTPRHDPLAPRMPRSSHDPGAAARVPGDCNRTKAATRAFAPIRAARTIPIVRLGVRRALWRPRRPLPTPMPHNRPCYRSSPVIRARPSERDRCRTRGATQVTPATRTCGSNKAGLDQPTAPSRARCHSRIFRSADMFLRLPHRQSTSA
jgi:hypothetical protein